MVLESKKRSICVMKAKQRPKSMYRRNGDSRQIYITGLGTHLFEYSLVIASVVSIGHLSTNALAASTLGSMTASVTD
ncbi:hypothetical protein A0H81_02054 [Grifola frondosa]|uniref:Uncharacterized protein n=1 Tax=Grifola frondosa TaxID=5627 RepID=A0A1C7MNC1_GRIFR|nr:hypothetical protein A0H81_02054 [Grifola frondosa]